MQDSDQLSCIFCPSLLRKYITMSLSAEFFHFKAGYLFLIWVLIYVFLALATNHLILTDAFYYTAFADRLTPDRIEATIAFARKYQWLICCLLPVLLFLKYIVIAGLLFASAYLFNQRLSFTESFKVVLVAETVWVLLALIRLGWFTIHPADTLEAVQRFNLLSLNQVFSVRALPGYLLYPLQQISLTEFGYWIFLAAGIQVFTQKSLRYAFKVVAAGYGVALCLWTLCIMLIQIQFAL
jgi:hypothetical protein